MTTRKGSRIALGFSLVITAALLAFSCGGDDDSGFGPGSQECPTGCQSGCDAALGCVQCFGDDDCPLSEPRCVLGRCEECRTNDDCGVGQACFPRNHSCETACSEMNLGVCDGDERTCDVNMGQCVGCLSHTDCPVDNPVCNPDSGQCGQCARDADCGLTEPACDLRDGRCRECLINSHCPRGFACGNDHECHPFCSSDNDCDEGVCVDGSCVECRTNDHCAAAAPICDEDHECVQCTENAHCPQATPICRDARECVGCVEDADCPALLPACRDAICVQCDNDEHCTDPLLPRCRDQQCAAE